MVREGVTALQCKLRFWQLQHFERQAGPFTAQESGNVVAAVRQHGHDWAKVHIPFLVYCMEVPYQH